MNKEEDDIREEILSASFWVNYGFAKELSKSKSPKANKVLLETEKIRADWINHQKSCIKEV